MMCFITIVGMMLQELFMINVKVMKNLTSENQSRAVLLT